MARLISGARMRRARADTLFVAVFGVSRLMKTANRDEVAGGRINLNAEVINKGFLLIC